MDHAPKQFLYHMVPADMKSDSEGKKIIHPLNILKEKFPELYEVKSKKYNIVEPSDTENKRKTVTESIIPTLQNAAWGDVINLTAIHPEDLRKTLIEAGLKPENHKFYQIDPDVLDPEKTTIYLYRNGIEDESADNFKPYNPKDLRKYAMIPDDTKKYYTKKAKAGERPLLFVGVPHILHKGSIDVSNFPVITAEKTEDSKE